MAYSVVYELLCTKWVYDTSVRLFKHFMRVGVTTFKQQKGIEWELPKAIREHGVESFENESSVSVKHKKNSTLLSAKWIDDLNMIWPDGYNMRNGSQYTHTHEMIRGLMRQAKLGKCLSDEYKCKIGEGHLSKPSGMLGKHHTEKSKRKIGAALKGRPKGLFTREHRAKLSAVRKGQTPWNKGFKYKLRKD